MCKVNKKWRRGILLQTVFTVRHVHEPKTNFQDLYVYILLRWEIFLAYMSTYCLQSSKKVEKIDFFSRAPATKKGFLEGFARKREKILKFYATGALE